MSSPAPSCPDPYPALTATDHQDLLGSVQQHYRRFGFKVRIHGRKKRPNGEVHRVDIQCACGGSASSKSRGLRNRKSMRTNCQWIGTLKNNGDGTWVFVPGRHTHNHPPSIDVKPSDPHAGLSRKEIRARRRAAAGRARVRAVLPDLDLGPWRPGPRNTLTDVPGVLVSTQSLHPTPTVNTGVTAILPRKDWLTQACHAGLFSFDGTAELTGSRWLVDKGLLSSPVVLTNSYAVGDAHRGVYEHAVAHYPDAADRGGLDAHLAPVVAETYDGYLSDISKMAVKPADVTRAIDMATDDPVEEGNSGGGTGAVCHHWKGGTGSSSRVVPGTDTDGRDVDYTVGVLVQANHGEARDLRVGGAPIGRLLRREEQSRAEMLAHETDDEKRAREEFEKQQSQPHRPPNPNQPPNPAQAQATAQAGPATSPQQPRFVPRTDQAFANPQRLPPQAQQQQNMYHPAHQQQGQPQPQPQPHQHQPPHQQGHWLMDMLHVQLQAQQQELQAQGRLRPTPQEEQRQQQRQRLIEMLQVQLQALQEQEQQARAGLRSTPHEQQQQQQIQMQRMRLIEMLQGQLQARQQDQQAQARQQPTLQIQQEHHLQQRYEEHRQHLQQQQPQQQQSQRQQARQQRAQQQQDQEQQAQQQQQQQTSPAPEPRNYQHIYWQSNLAEHNRQKPGGIIAVVATDAPLSPAQCERLAKRATAGLTRVDCYGRGSRGDIFLALSTGNSLPVRRSRNTETAKGKVDGEVEGVRREGGHENGRESGRQGNREGNREGGSESEHEDGSDSDGEDGHESDREGDGEGARESNRKGEGQVNGENAAATYAPAVDPLKPKALAVEAVDDTTMDGLFEAAADAVEEAIYNALCMAEPMLGFLDRKVEALPLPRLKALMERYH